MVWDGYDITRIWLISTCSFEQKTHGNLRKPPLFHPTMRRFPPLEKYIRPYGGAIWVPSLFWKIISYLEDHPRTCKWLVSPIYKPFRPLVRGTTRSLGDLRSPWLLTTYPSHGMILQVIRPSSRLEPMKNPKGMLVFAKSAYQSFANWLDSWSKKWPVQQYVPRKNGGAK